MVMYSNYEVPMTRYFRSCGGLGEDWKDRAVALGRAFGVVYHGAVGGERIRLGGSSRSWVGGWRSDLLVKPGCSCPFCGSTAFRVRLAFGVFHCFECGGGGDAVVFTAGVETAPRLGGVVF